MKTRQAIYKDCQKCDEPPNCGVAPERCNIFVVPEPVIEVGDVVQGLADKGTVIHRGDFSTNGERVIIQDKQGAFWIDRVSNCTLIRKGPKVERYEGARIKRWISDGVVIELPPCSALPSEYSKGTFTMTLAKETVEPELDGRN